MIQEMNVMNKEEILAKSRQENKEGDLPVLSNYKTSCVITLIAAWLTGMVILFAERKVYGEFNPGLYATLSAVPFIWCLSSCFKMPRKYKFTMIAATVIWGIFFALFMFVEISSLIEFKG